MSVASELDPLVQVFAYHVVAEVVAADGTVDDEERAFLEARWPRQRFAELGLFDSTGAPTGAFHEACSSAVAQLKTALSQDDKLALLDTFLEASLADGELHPAESATVSRAAKLLGLHGSAVLERLEGLGVVGELELPEPDGVDTFLQLVEDPDGETVTPADAATETPDDVDTAVPKDR